MPDSFKFDHSYRRYLNKKCSKFTKALELYSDISTLHFNLGNVYAAQGKHEEAINKFDTAINLDSDNPDIFYNKGNS
jgi:tetratricopeptide (TPR) repeat protein